MLVEREHLRLENLAAAEGQELTGEGRRALSGMADLSMSARIDRLTRNVLKHEVAEAQDAGEEVVEVVGDAAGQLSHGFHLLRLPQLSSLRRSARQVVLALDRDLGQVGRDAEQSRIVGVGA